MNIYCVVPTYKESHDWHNTGILQQTERISGTVICHDDYETPWGGIECNYPGHSVKNINEHWIGFRRYALKNIVYSINFLHKKYGLQDDDIIVLIDGDDQLYDNTVLQTVFHAYQQYNCWLTYGSYVKLSDERTGNPCHLYRSRYRTGDEFRDTQWRGSHLKTFKYGLWKHLTEDMFKGPDGEWLRVCSDLAIMFPLMEMAGHERIHHINKPLYIYNDMNPLNDHKVSGKEQKEIEKWLRERPKLKKLKSL